MTKKTSKTIAVKWHKPQRNKITFIRDWVSNDLGDIIRSRKDFNLASSL